MKTTTVARGFIGAVASLLGVVAVGCSAGGWDEGAAGEGEIGSTEQALGSPGFVANFPSTARYLPASCVLSATRDFDSNPANGNETRDVMLVATGYSSAGVGLLDAAMYEPISNTWTAVESLPNGQGRGEALMIKIPGENACLMAGGLSNITGGSERVKSFKFSPNTTADGQWDDVGDLASGRGKHALIECGNQIAVLGGHKANGVTLDNDANANEKEMEIWNGTNAWSSTGVADILEPEVAGFAFTARDSSKLAVAGGRDPGGNFVSKVQAFVSANGTNGACAPSQLANVADLRVEASPQTTAEGRWAAVAVRRTINADSDFVYVAAGETASALPRNVQQFTVTWTGGGTLGAAYTAQFSGANEIVPTATRFPSVAIRTASKIGLFGGELQDDLDPYEATPTNSAQELDVATSATPSWTANTTALTKDNVNHDGKLGAAVQSLGSNWYVTTGLVLQGTPTLTVKTDKLNH